MLFRGKREASPSSPKKQAREPMNSKPVSDTQMVLRAIRECVPSKPISKSEEPGLIAALKIPKNVQVIQGVEGVAFCSKGLSVPNMGDETDPFVRAGVPAWLNSSDAWYLAVRPEGMAISLLLIDNSRKVHVQVEISNEREDDGLERSWQEVIRRVKACLH